MNVCCIDDDDYIKVRSVDFGKGAAMFSACVSSDREGGVIEMYLDRPDGQLIGVLEVPNTGGLDNWQVCRTGIGNASGVHDLFFVFKGKGEAKEDLFRFDYWQFEPANK